MNPLRILFVASECQPFVKTGGLADVVGTLPKFLHRMGHDVRIVIPRYRDIEGGKYRLLPLMPEMKVQYGPQTLVGEVARCSFPGTQMPVYFIDEPNLFQRQGIYGHGRADFTDNDRRFAFFSMAALWLLKGLDWQPDIIHLNDWQTGLLPALLRHHPEVVADPFYESIRTVFAVHNLPYQGNMEKFVIPAIGLPWSVFTHDGLEFYNKASFLKSGLVYSDALVTVSPNYAREIQLEEFGAGMHGTLQMRSSDLIGILNGIDPEEWNPSRDRYLEKSFDIDDLSGKADCKRALQEMAGLPRDPSVPLVGMVSRLITGKGFDLVMAGLEGLVGMGVQFYVLGSGDETYEDGLRRFALEHPNQVSVHVGYDHILSHKVLAGADMLLMPSAYEPCGLTQLYAMRQGTIPVARQTGGLTDTITHATPDAINNGTGTGFLFSDYNTGAMLAALAQALEVKKSPETWTQLMRNAMRQDFSWDRSAREYTNLYEKVIAKERS